MRIRPCIDIHDGKVKQIVGSSLHDKQEKQENEAAAGKTDAAKKIDPAGMIRAADAAENYSAVAGNASAENGTADGSTVKNNFISSLDASYYAALYRRKNLPGGHIILLNSVKEPEQYAEDRRQAIQALQAFPGGMQIGGGITPQTAPEYISRGASHVIVTSYVFRNGQLDMDRLREMTSAVGREHLVLDLSCKKVAVNEPAPFLPEPFQYLVVTDRWQKLTKLAITRENLDFLSAWCDEFLIHAADVEGKRGGIETKLVQILGEWQKESGFPITYAGGVHSLDDLDLIRRFSSGRMDVTVGSALKIFGGNLELDALVDRAQQGKNDQR